MTLAPTLTLTLALALTLTLTRRAAHDSGGGPRRRKRGGDLAGAVGDRPPFEPGTQVDPVFIEWLQMAHPVLRRALLGQRRGLPRGQGLDALEDATLPGQQPPPASPTHPFTHPSTLPPC